MIFGAVSPRHATRKKKKDRIPKTEEERDTDKCAFEENISRLHGTQAELSLLSSAGPISVDESHRLFEVVPWHYPRIRHQVIERPKRRGRVCLVLSYPCTLNTNTSAALLILLPFFTSCTQNIFYLHKKPISLKYCYMSKIVRERFVFAEIIYPI